MPHVQGLNRIMSPRNNGGYNNYVNKALMDTLGLEAYFKNIVYEGDGTLRPNMIMFKSRVILNYKTVATADFDSNGIPLTSRFFENYTTWDRSADFRDALPVTEIRVNDRFFGFYVHDVKSFVLATACVDSSSSSSSHFMAFKHILSCMVKHFDVKASGKVVKKFVEQRPKVNITLGADPEFEMIDSQGAVINAGNVMSGDRLVAEVGRDGAGAQVELRPPPGKTPTEFVRNLRGVFKKFNRMYKDYHLSVRGHVYPLGGHIHAGVGFPFLPSSDMVMALDDFIGKPTLNLSGRARESYKRLSEVREQPHGFEYRTPPVAIFTRPTITKIVAKIFQNLMDAYVNTQGFTYNDTPSDEDYMKIAGLTKREVATFRAFCKTYNQQSVGDRGYTLATAFWAGQKPPAKGRVRSGASRLSFRGTWDNADILAEWKSMVIPLFKQYGRGDYDIGFYGYRADRELVTNIQNSPFRNIGDPNGLGTPSLHIGLPYAFRNDPDIFAMYKNRMLTAVGSLMLRQSELLREDGEM